MSLLLLLFIGISWVEGQTIPVFEFLKGLSFQVRLDSQGFIGCIEVSTSMTPDFLNTQFTAIFEKLIRDEDFWLETKYIMNRMDTLTWDCITQDSTLSLFQALKHLDQENFEDFFKRTYSLWKSRRSYLYTYWVSRATSQNNLKNFKALGIISGQALDSLIHEIKNLGVYEYQSCKQ